MGTDITLAVPVDGTLQITQAWLNANVRDALYQYLSPPTCLLLKTDTMTYAASLAWTAIVWNSLIADTEDPATPMYAAGSPSRVTVSTPGWYECSAMVPASIATTNTAFSIAIRKNGATFYAGDTISFRDASVSHISNMSTLISMAAADYLEVVVRTSNASALTSIVLWGGPRFTVRRVRGL